jgi:DNA gyrase inhibitor GyrI
LPNIDFPDLPDEFVEEIRRKGKKVMTLAEIVEEFKVWRRRHDRNL